MSRLQSFVKDNLEHLITQDRDIQKHFCDTTGKRLDNNDPAYQTHKNKLEKALEQAYDSKLRPYDKKTFLQKYVATPLRYLAGAGYIGGTALFFGLPGPAGFGLTGLGVLSSTLADMIDTYAYIKHDQMKGRRALEVAAEDLVTKPLAYLPIGTGLLDLYRGRRKFEAKVAKDLQPIVQDALSYAKGLFLDSVYATTKDERNIIPLRVLRDERYAPAAMKQAA